MEWYNWLLSVFLFIVIPFSVIVCRLMAIKALGKKGYNKKYFVISLIKNTCFYWLLGAFHLCAIFSVLLWTFIFGGIAMVIIFYNLANAFVRQNERGNTLNKIGLLQDFIVGIILTVYLIYIIPEKIEGLQTIVTAIVAALYGGLLTLVGVAWTINYTTAQKHKEELAKAKPLFTFNYFAETNPKVNNRKVCLVGDAVSPEYIYDSDSTYTITEAYINIENSVQSPFTIKRFYYDGKWHMAEANNVVLPGNQMLVQLLRKDIINHPIMEVEDTFHRKYYYDLFFVSIGLAVTSKFYTLSQIEEISKADVAKRNIDI